MSNTTSINPSKSALVWRWIKKIFKWGAAFFGVSLALFIVLDLLGFVTVGDAVEAFRKVTGEPGTRLVRWAEEIYFEARYDVSVWWNGEEKEPSSNVTAKALIVQAPKVTAKQLSEPTSQSQPAAVQDPYAPIPGDIPWTPYSHADGSASGIYTAQIFPNNKLPEQPVYLAWMDPSKLAFRWVPGTVEPEPEQDGYPDGPLDRSGLVPKKDWPSLVAAFNGGYLSKHGHAGAMFEGTQVLEPRDGYATAALTKDGKIRIGAWGREFSAKDKDILTYRQNMRLIVDDGQIPEDIWKRTRGASRPNASLYDPLEGDLKAHTWRSGIGVSKSGALIFAAGDYLDGQLLAEALHLAGAEQAMQLDVNAPYFCVFLLFEPADDKGNLEGFVLGPTMTPRNGQFLTGRNQKDFVYVTKR